MNPLTKTGTNFIMNIPKPEGKVNNQLVKLDVEHQHHVQDVKLEIEKEDHAW